MTPTLGELLATLPQIGRLHWIGVREEQRGSIRPLQRVRALTDQGLDGDHRAQRRGGKRQVTLIQHEHLPVIAALCGRDVVDPAWLRRNLVICGLNLIALRDRVFAIGDVELRGAGLCAPCSRMEQILGAGGYNAMRGHGGICAQVTRGGELVIGAPVRVLDTVSPRDSAR